MDRRRAEQSANIFDFNFQNPAIAFAAGEAFDSMRGPDPVLWKNLARDQLLLHSNLDEATQKQLVGVVAVTLVEINNIDEYDFVEGKWQEADTEK
jgi:hypothetical protein